MPGIVIRPYSFIAAIALVLLGGLIGYGSGKKIEETLHYSGNLERANSLAVDLLRRTELTVDYAYITISDFAALGLGSCSTTTISEAETALLTRGAVRSVGVLNENDEFICTVPEAALPLAKAGAWEASTFLSARNDAVLIGHSGELLLVRTRQGNSHVLAATSLDTILYDFLPGDLRDFSMAKIVLTGGDIVANFIGASAGYVDATGEVQRFVAASNRFPLAVEIAIPEHVLSSWGEGDTNRLTIAGGLIGLLASGLMAALVLRARTARDELLEGISSGQIIPYYQPIFSLKSGSLSGCEALARWIRSDGSPIGPDRFIPLAESEGLVAHLTLHIATACARDLGPLCRDRPDFKLSINLPPDLLLTEEFIRALAAVFQRENLPLTNVVLELTERQSIQDVEAVKSTMALARVLGFRFALDDTGVGHNGLSNVHSLPVDFIKIDKCFIDMIDKSPVSASVIRMLVSLARDLSMKTVAEGIERVEQMAALRDLGVDEGQGYIAAPALAPDLFIELAMEWFTLEVDRHSQTAPADAKPASKVGVIMNLAA